MHFWNPFPGLSSIMLTGTSYRSFSVISIFRVILRAIKEIHPSAVSFHPIREVIPRSSYAFS